MSDVIISLLLMMMNKGSIILICLVSMTLTKELRYEDVIEKTVGRLRDGEYHEAIEMLNLLEPYFDDDVLATPPPRSALKDKLMVSWVGRMLPTGKEKVSKAEEKAAKKAAKEKERADREQKKKEEQEAARQKKLQNTTYSVRYFNIQLLQAK